MNDIIKKILGSSPRTTTFGTLAGICTAAIPILPPKYKEYASFGAAVFIILAHRNAKDSDGITAKQDVIVAKEATDGEIPK